MLFGADYIYNNQNPIENQESSILGFSYSILINLIRNLYGAGSSRNQKDSKLFVLNANKLNQEFVSNRTLSKV